MLLTFHQVSTRQSTIDDLREAVLQSSVLQLDETKTLVRRKDQSLPNRPAQDEIDSRTIYMERLALNVTHESLKAAIEPIFGAIDYISLPRFESNGQLKGFCFVEFHSVESVRSMLSDWSSVDPSPKKEAEFLQNARIMSKYLLSCIHTLPSCIY